MENKKKYKAVNTQNEGPFEGWIIQELDDDEYKQAEEDEKQREAAKPAKMTPADLEKKRQEQISKIRELIEKKKSQNAAQAANTSSNAAKSASLEASEDLLVQKSMETGIPVEVLRMIEEKKKALREKNKPQGGKPKGAPQGEEIADTKEKEKRRREMEEDYQSREGHLDRENE